LLIVITLLLAACGGNAPAPGPVAPTAGQTVAPENQVTTTPTVPPERTLVVCVGQEPTTLYRYGGSQRSMWTVLEAVYDGPIDTNGFTPQPVILTGLPNEADGSMAGQPVEVKAGDEVIDSNGELTVLQAGSRVRPAGCLSDQCALEWDGTSPLQMDQLTLRYTLLEGLTWSDGAPLTAADSLYAFNLSADPATPVTKRAVDRTRAYRAVDERTVEWVGKPGFRPDPMGAYFWSPLPEHAWGQLPAAELLTAETSSRRPLGWGPYVIQEWVQGDHITLARNESYFRRAEGLPYFDTLVYRFVGETPDSTLNAVLAGECDIVDQTALLETQLPRVQELVTRGLIQAVVGQGPEWEHMDFGIRPATYDTAAGNTAGLRPDFFSDARVRQAFALCADRAQLVQTLFGAFGQVANSFLPPSHPNYIKEGPQYAYDPAAGQALLDEAGWIDNDNDPATVRVSAGVAGVPEGTPLVVEYLTTDAPQRKAAAQALALSLMSCGIGVTPRSVTTAELYAPGPDGPLFGRKFDLAQFAWQAGSSSPCFLYTSEQVPSAENDWLTVNVTGYSNAEYDAACARALEAPRDDAFQQQAQRLFIEQLPVVPLYYHLKLLAARPDLCGLSLDVSARSELWNLEQLDYGETCP
jgi:peptide/nickel transport system substrate-binding protein